MIILDTDHINIMQNEQSAQHFALTANMSASRDQHFVTTAITLEEQMRGWLALVHRSHDAHHQVLAYARLNDVVDYFSRWTRLAFDEAAADQFKELRRQKVWIGTMDPGLFT